MRWETTMTTDELKLFCVTIECDVCMSATGRKPRTEGPGCEKAGVKLDADGAVVGAGGISGDNSDNDEAAAIAGIQAAGLVADPG